MKCERCKQKHVYNLSCPHCAARLLLSGWALPAQRRALWAAIERRPGAPAKAAVHELVKAALGS